MSAYDEIKARRQRQEDASNTKFARNCFLGSVFLLMAGGVGVYHYDTAAEEIRGALPEQAIQAHPLRSQFKIQCTKNAIEKQSGDIASSYAANPQTPIILDTKPIEFCVDNMARNDLVASSPDLPPNGRLWSYIALAGFAGAVAYGMAALTEKRSSKPELKR